MEDCTLTSNPDISGRGVLIAIYLQNFLCFFPAVWALWDGEVTEYELDSVENHSLTNLILAFAILVSCIVQALGTRGLSNYHASIVLSMSWMNNTNAFIYFLLYAQYKTQQGVKPQWSAWGGHLRNRFCVVLQPFQNHGHPRLDASHVACYCVAPRLKRKMVRTALEGNLRIAIVLGSLHLTLMAALGIWLWSAPQSFGTPDTDPECAFTLAKVAVLGVHIPFHSDALRNFSITAYSLFIIPGLNLLLPIVVFLWFHHVHHALFAERRPLPEVGPHPDLTVAKNGTQQPESLRGRTLRAVQSSKAFLSKFIQSPVFPAYFGLALLLAIDIILIVDIELTLQQNKHLQGSEESHWGFGQILALLLLTMPLRDLVEAVFRRRQEMQTQLNNALKKAIDEGDTEKIRQWLHAGADSGITSDQFHRTALEAALLASDWIIFRELLAKNSDLRSQIRDFPRALEAATLGKQWDLVLLLVETNINLNFQFSDRSGTALHAACKHAPLEIIELLLEKGADIRVTAARSGRSCLHTARSAGRADIVQLLFQRGARLNATELRNGELYLHAACSAGRKDIVKLLLECGVNPNFQDANGKTPLHPACISKNGEVVVLLLRHGAKPSKENIDDLCKIARSLSSSSKVAADLDRAILVQSAVLGVHHQVKDMVYTKSLLHLSDCYALRSKVGGSSADLDEAVLLKRKALKCLPLNHMDRVKCLIDLATLLHRLSERAPGPCLDILNEAVCLEREALKLRPPGSQGRAMPLWALATSLYRRSLEGTSGLNDNGDLGQAIRLGKEALDLQPNDSRHRLSILGGLRVFTCRRAQISGSKRDLNEATRFGVEELRLLNHGRHRKQVRWETRGQRGTTVEVGTASRGPP